MKAQVLMQLRPPVEIALTLALRRLARRRPEVFERLGPARGAVFVIAPWELPVCFRLGPRGADGWVNVVQDNEACACDVRIEGPLRTLLRLFDGSADADAAFFSRSLVVSGDTEAAMALHNAIEAAELDLAELTGAAAPAVRRLVRAVAIGRRFLAPRPGVA
ncbi:SCP2 domain-containing protein [Phenylobacterium sp.]|uniref:ubiquinone anaerobic biosynthesis accessory factor UbiT n=1 Tax=Phenylobacterium sp. TaxID=1871053 RepID=UPI003943EC6B